MNKQHDKARSMPATTPVSKRAGIAINKPANAPIDKRVKHPANTLINKP